MGSEMCIRDRSVYHDSMVTPVVPKFPPISTGLVNVIRLAAVLAPRPVRLSFPDETVDPPSKTPVLPPTESVVSVSKEYRCASVAPLASPTTNAEVRMKVVFIICFSLLY